MSYWASASIKTRTHVHPYCVAFVTIMATLVTKMGMVFDLYLKTFAMKTWLVLLNAGGGKGTLNRDDMLRVLQKMRPEDLCSQADGVV